ncbi:hypothetical protein ACTVCO_01320 [Sanguibacter sp. A247]|uniref:hypothetical protein n=1 Tax=unclassified Sanguibacter TaxID=2645534 RepID=UPI003FD6D6AF
MKENSLTFEAGRKYVVPMYVDGQSAAWVAMTGAALPYDGGVVGSGEAFVSKEGRVAEPRNDAGREIWGGDATVIREKLGVAVPEPASQKHLDLPAPRRYVAAQEDIRGAAQ